MGMKLPASRVVSVVLQDELSPPAAGLKSLVCPLLLYHRHCVVHSGPTSMRAEASVTTIPEYEGELQIWPDDSVPVRTHPDSV